MRMRQKKLIVLGLICLLLACFSNSAHALTDFASLEGAVIVAQDGQFLGVITVNAFDSDSIMNSFGTYGSEFSSKSIFNEFGRYGSEFSSLSAFNSIASKPPMIYEDGEFVAYLTVNTIKTPRVDPYALVGWLRANE